MSGIGAPSVTRGTLNQTKKFQFANLSSEDSEDLRSDIDSSHSNPLLNQIVSQEPFCNKLESENSYLEEPLLHDSIEDDHNSQATNESCSQASQQLVIPLKKTLECHPENIQYQQFAEEPDDSSPER